MDKWQVYKKLDDFRVQAPKSVLDVVEIRSIDENGIFEVGRGGIFTKTYKIDDLNYDTASVDEQMAILENWCKWLNSNSAPFKITVNNKNKNMATIRKEVLLGKKMDDFDEFRDMFNEEIEYTITNGRQGIEQELYLTVRYDVSNSYENARTYFSTLENGMMQAYREIGSNLVPLNATERLRILHDFYRFGNEEYFEFDFRRAVEQGFDFKNAIINTRLDFSYETYFKTDDKYCSCIYLKELPVKLTDRILVELSKLPVKMMCTLDVAPISNTDVEDMLKGLYLGVEDRIRKQSKSRVKEMNFNSDISLAVKMEKDTIEQLIKDKNEEDQHFFYTMLNIVVISDSLEQLKKDTELIIITAKNRSCTLDYSYMRQREALNTILPIGVRNVSNGINLQTKSLAALFPFNVQELYVPGGLWYGSNLVSKNLCTANRKRLMNPHAMFFGATGSGKTTTCKLEMSQVFLDTDDDIILIDPKQDYKELCELLKGSYVDISTTSNSRYNPLEYYDNGSRGEIVAEKTELVLSIVETCKKLPLSAQERSLVVRALRHAYNEAELENRMPTLADLYHSFGKMPETEAKDLQLYLEAFVKGTLNIFSEQSNVDMGTNRVTMFGMKNMGAELRDISMLIMLECVKEKIYRNAERGKSTWLYIDEFHEVLHTEYSQNYIKSLWMLVRSLGGICTAMTQNVTDVLLSYNTKAMLDNSEFVIILKQQAGAIDQLIDDVGLSPELIKYVTANEAGKGIIRSGSVTVPFSVRLNENNRLFNKLDKNFYREFETQRYRNNNEYEQI